MPCGRPKRPLTFSASDQLQYAFAALLICLAMPNTQEWLGRYRPGLNIDWRRSHTLLGRLMWRPTAPWWAVTLALLTYAVLTFGDTSEFIYWQF